jgi:DNA polymerase-3 subunit delta
VKASRTNIARAVDQPVAGTRFYLFHGPDEGQSRALAMRLLDALGATKFAMAGGAVKSDPAALVDEASAMSLFGGNRAIWIEPATKDIEEGVATLLDGAAVESPVIAIGGTLTKASPLLKLAEASPLALAFASYLPEGQDAERMVIDLGRRFGLKVSGTVAARLAESSGNDQAIVARELEKFALYLGASPEAPRELDHQVLDAVGIEYGEGEPNRLADLALTGDVDEVAEELARLPSAGNDAVPVVRALQRRLLMLGPLRARVERGERPDGVLTSLGKSLFFKDQAKIRRMLRNWSAEDLATAAERAGKLERSLMFTAVPHREALGEELLAIARKARSSI